MDLKSISLPPKELIEKYNRPGPRYTSYPTAPHWSNNFGPKEFYQTLQESNANQNPLSLYFHLPFCEERCTFCACSVVATKRHDLADPYLRALFKEVDTVAEVLDKNRRVVQIHWGGGTPTYLTSEQMEKLHTHVAEKFSVSAGAEISIEIDPRVTSDEQLITLKDLGFNRVSLGLQDFDPAVQQEAGRLQGETETRHAVQTCRFLGFKSVNIDLVYGLPKQTESGFEKTLQKVLALDPDRIALFNFAYVPWMHAHQKKISEADLPDPATKLKMFCRAIERFEEAGYEFIGLDHFAKQGDELVEAKKNGTMYRNFQGYTTHRECDLVGFGMTAISFVNRCFAQNAKKLKEYQEGVFKTGLTTHCGLRLNEDDLRRQTVIRELFCHQKVEWNGTFQPELDRLKKFEEDGLIKISAHEISVTKLGRLFLRNIGMVFDAYLKNGEGKFSKTV